MGEIVDPLRVRGMLNRVFIPASPDKRLSVGQGYFFYRYRGVNMALGSSYFTVLKQEWDSIIKNADEMTSLVGDKEKFTEFCILSNAILDAEFAIGLLANFVAGNQKIPKAAYDALWKEWSEFKAKINLFA
jgi:hypothetical protein